MRKILLLSLLSISLFSCKNNTENTENSATEEIVAEPQNIQEQIAFANGFQEFENVEQLDFTFNVKVSDTLRSQRKWNWNTKTNEISLTEKDTTITYSKNDITSDVDKQIDQKFINDTYWLLFPYQLIWADATYTEEENVTAPISGEQMHKLIVTYPSEGGYTPGDTYELYFGDDYIVKEWKYISSQGREMVTTWEDYSDYEGIKIAKSHKSPDGSFELFFTDIAVN